eukprot:m51a1_g2434 putative lissencephaly-1 homolog (69) ;mRNA; f:848075-848383
MSSLLSPKQQQDLNDSIAEYLAARGYAKAAAAFAAESGAQSPAPPPSGGAALERKWLAVARLTLKARI